MNSEIRLPSFQHIDTQLGLKFLNNNKKLYLKILTNFLNRYKDLKIEDLDDKQLKDTIHGLKGLSATLGMVEVTQLATTIHETQNREKLPELSNALALVIDELEVALNEESSKTILIINSNPEDIDILIDHLEDMYDVMVALDAKSAIESIETEDIALVLLDKGMGNIDISHHNIILTSQPFNINKLKNDIKTHLKFKDIK